MTLVTAGPGSVILNGHESQAETVRHWVGGPPAVANLQAGFVGVAVCAISWVLFFQIFQVTRDSMADKTILKIAVISTAIGLGAILLPRQALIVLKGRDRQASSSGASQAIAAFLIASWGTLAIVFYFLLTSAHTISIGPATYDRPPPWVDLALYIATSLTAATIIAGTVAQQRRNGEDCARHTQEGSWIATIGWLAILALMAAALFLSLFDNLAMHYAEADFGAISTVSAGAVLASLYLAFTVGQEFATCKAEAISLLSTVTVTVTWITFGISYFWLLPHYGTYTTDTEYIPGLQSISHSSTDVSIALYSIASGLLIARGFMGNRGTKQSR